MKQGGLGKGDVLLSRREFWAVPILLVFSMPFVLWSHFTGGDPLWVRVLAFVFLFASITVALRPFLLQCYPMSRTGGKTIIHRELVVMFLIVFAIYIGLVLSVFDWVFEVSLYRLLQ